MLEFSDDEALLNRDALQNDSDYEAVCGPSRLKKDSSLFSVGDFLNLDSGVSKPSEIQSHPGQGYPTPLSQAR